MKENFMITTPPERIFERLVLINGVRHLVTIIQDDSCDDFGYYLQDDKGSFCTRLSDETFDGWDPEKGVSFESVKDFIESFGDPAREVLENTDGAFAVTVEKYGCWVNLICNEIVVMQE